MKKRNVLLLILTLTITRSELLQADSWLVAIQNKSNQPVTFTTTERDNQNTILELTNLTVSPGQTKTFSKKILIPWHSKGGIFSSEIINYYIVATKGKDTHYLQERYDKKDKKSSVFLGALLGKEEGVGGNKYPTNKDYTLVFETDGTASLSVGLPIRSTPVRSPEKIAEERAAGEELIKAHEKMEKAQEKLEKIQRKEKEAREQIERTIEQIPLLKKQVNELDDKVNRIKTEIDRDAQKLCPIKFKLNKMSCIEEYFKKHPEKGTELEQAIKERSDAFTKENGNLFQGERLKLEAGSLAQEREKREKEANEARLNFRNAMERMDKIRQS